MRKRGWQGSPPADDDEAREWIIDAAMRCIDRNGAAKTGLSDVATELGVTRQTVYRLFPSTDDLFSAVAVASTDSFIDRVVAQMAGVTDPAELILECLAYALEQLPNERYLGLLLTTGREVSFSRGVTSSVAFQLAHALLTRLDVDWQGIGYRQRDLDELVEVFLRFLQSFVLYSGPERTPAERRAFLRRWLAPGITARARPAGRCGEQSGLAQG